MNYSKSCLIDCFLCNFLMIRTVSDCLYELSEGKFYSPVHWKHWFVQECNKSLWVSQWIVYTTDSFKTHILSETQLVFMSESLNHLHNRFVQITDLLRNKTNVLLAGQLQLIIFIWTIWTIFTGKAKKKSLHRKRFFILLRCFTIVFHNSKTWHSS